MFVDNISYYIPSSKITNRYFEDLNGLTNDWIVERTGIQERRKAHSEENTNTMAIEAVKELEGDGYLSDVDLIVGGSYTPHDTIVTHAHAVQHYLDKSDIPVVYISSACSSFLNSMEIVEGYFALNKASKALVILSEHNTLYNNEHDQKAGHLWGDGAVALVVTNERLSEGAMEVKEIKTGGAGNVGKAIEGVYLRPANGGLHMINGKDVFIHACNYMTQTTQDILTRNGYTLNDLTYLIPHQANLRITKKVSENLQLPLEKALSNIQYLGNTGSAGSAIVLGEHWGKFQKGEVIVVTVFGGGYSYGAMLLEK